MKTSELSGTALDWAISVSLEQNPVFRHDHMRAKALANDYKGDLAWHLGMQLNEPITVTPSRVTKPVGDYHKNWSLSGPTLTEARISRTIDHSGLWVAYYAEGYGEPEDDRKFMQCDRSELVAGLRCFVEKTLGSEVEIPVTLI